MSKSKENSRAEAFKKYFHPNTDAQQKEVLQNEIEMDSFEKEALEGFNSLGDSKQVLAAMQAIEIKIAERTGLEKESNLKFPLWRTLGIAASVLFIALGAFTLSKFIEKEDNHLAVNSETNSVELEPIVEDEVLDLESGFDSFEVVESQSLMQQDAIVKTKIDELKPTEEKSLKDKKVVSPTVSSPTYFKEEMMEESNDVAMDFTISDAEEEVAGKGDKQFSKEERSASSTSKVVEQNLSALNQEYNSDSDFDLAKAKYAAGDFNTAIVLFEKTANNSELKNESNFYIGMSNFNLGKSNKAIKAFDAVIASPSPLKNNSKWFKSLLLLDKGQTSDAKKLLTELANGNSTFKQQAQDKLKSLD